MNVDRDTAKTVLVGASAAFGVLAWLTPNALGRMYGLDPNANPAAPFLLRAFAGRNLMIAGLLQSATGAQLDDVAKGITMLSASDAAAATIAGTTGQIPKQSAAMVAATALPFILLARVLRDPSTRR